LLSVKKNFPAEAVDHSYDDIYQVARKNPELFSGNGNVERKTGSERSNSRGRW
jgi:hypothetical protein